MAEHEYACIPLDQHRDDVSRLEALALEAQVDAMNQKHAADVQRERAIKAERRIEELTVQHVRLQRYIALKAVQKWEKRQYD